MIELEGQGIRLRAFRPDELPLLVAERQADPSLPPKRTSAPMLRTKIRRSGRFVDGRLDLAIEGSGALIGSIEARQPRREMPAGVYEIGISLLPVERGRGAGTEAVRTLVRYLFDEADAHRVQASTALTNSAMRRVLEKLGFGFEGVLREFMPAPDGARVDYALYAITRSDWNGAGPSPAQDS
ncbi:MAG: GNAT family N-acetyltransferase [Actinobacteria bacterium]|nr:GNAT family N-acetyltransferase [Actinomycetota bacterium]